MALFSASSNGLIWADEALAFAFTFALGALSAGCFLVLPIIPKCLKLSRLETEKPAVVIWY